MVTPVDFHNVSVNKRAVGASASANLTDLQITYLPLARLRCSPNNPRTHSRKQLKQIAKSIERFGFVNPVLIADDFEIIAGHGRVEAAKLLGLSEVPTVRLSSLSPAERRAYLIADNRLAQLAGWDREVLASELQELQDLQFEDIELTGFSLGEIDLILDRTAEENERPQPEDELPASSLQGPPVSRAGDVWALGPHRLLCGDPGDPASVRIVLEGQQTDLVLTDPRGALAIEDYRSARQAKLATATGAMGDDQCVAAFLQCLKEHTKDGAILFVFVDWRCLYELIAASRTAGLTLADLVVWVQDGAARDSFYRCGHELVLVLKNGGALQSIESDQGTRRRSNIWEYARIDSLRPPRTEDLAALHCAVKPTALVADAIEDASYRGAVVLDPCAGAGTTIIAAEKTGRLGRAIERDPLYCDLIVRRWQQYAGKAAQLKGSHLTFEDVAATRLAGRSAAQSRGSE